jgi:cation transport ATPase
LYANKAIKLDYQLQSREGLRDDFQTMSEIQAYLKNYKSALYYFKKFVSMSDSLVNQESREKIANYMVQFEFQKQQYSDSLKKAEEKKREGLKMELEEKELQRLMNIQYSGIVIFVMVVLGSIFLLRRVQLPTIWIEGFIFFSALLVFEFLYLFLDPYIEKFSGKMPIYKFTINMGLAIAVFYAHSFFEALLKTKLIKEGKKE